MLRPSFVSVLVSILAASSVALAHTTIKSPATLIKVAIADICSIRRPLLRPEKVNLWIPDNGSAIAAAALAAGVEGIGGPATLTVSRVLSSNPRPAACGAGFDVTATPSAAQIDRDLPIGRYWSPR